MIVPEGNQDRFAFSSVLQSVAGIVERRHTCHPGQRADPQDRRRAAADHQRPGNPDPHHGRLGGDDGDFTTTVARASSSTSCAPCRPTRR